MMKYKFRGKREDNGEWVYGELVTNKESGAHRIVSDFKIVCNDQEGNVSCCGNFYVVDPKTVGMWTEYFNKDHIDVYEGDIVERDGFVGVVTFEFAGWHFVKHESSKCYQYPSFHSNIIDFVTVGTIHDKPVTYSQETEG